MYLSMEGDCLSLRRYYAANAPVYQVDILDTTTMTFVGGESLFGHLCCAIEWAENVSLVCVCRPWGY